LKKLYQFEWHGISLDEIEAFSKSLPSESFYNKFYDKLFEKYNSFEELDEHWLEYKNEVTVCLNSHLKKKINVLSIGSGIGIVENTLTKLNPNLRITAIEPCENASRWIKDNPNIAVIDGYFPECLKRKFNFDFVYANNIDYVFNEHEYRDFLKSLVDYGVSEFLVISSANYDTWASLKIFVKEILGAMGIINKPDNGQFWGYLRSKIEHIEAMQRAGFNDIKITKLGTDTIFIKGKI
tara:strand:- start:1127 stop:1840 length:714 start_codon:yes stop_codon:yes gene_type:complete